MNILHISAVEKWGGGEMHLQNLCLEMECSEANHLVLCVKKGEVAEALAKTPINFLTAPLAFKADARFIWKIGRTCREHEIDLIHIHDTTALTLTVLSDNFFKLPPFIFSKKTSFPIKQRKQTLYKYNYPKIRKILCVSKETLDITSGAIEDKSKLKVIYHGTSFRDKKGVAGFTLREKFHLSPDVKIIGNLANHIRAKDLETFIRVADQIINKENRTDFVFIQIGSFTERSEALLRNISEHKLEDHVKFLGFIPQASNFLPQFDISLVTSQSEGLPQFIYESFFHEIPVVSTSVGGIPEAVKNGETGFLAEKHDHKTIARHILSLSENAELRQKFGSASKNLLLEKFSAKNMARQTLKEYKKAINGRSRTGSTENT